MPHCSACRRQGENVLEIGPGLGALTSALSEKAKNLLAVEIDRTLVGILADEFADKRSVQLLCSDFLKLPPAKSPMHSAERLLLLLQIFRTI